MSCHDIGRGMASVANVVIELYEGGQIGEDKQGAFAISDSPALYGYDFLRNDDLLSGNDQLHDVLSAFLSSNSVSVRRGKSGGRLNACRL